MSKMSNMAMTIEELRSAAAAINEAASWLAEVLLFGRHSKLLLPNIYSAACKHPKWSSCLIGCQPFPFSKIHSKIRDI